MISEMEAPTGPRWIPAARERFSLRMDDDAEIGVVVHGRRSARRLVLSHGNGLATDGYAPFWLPLCDRYEVVLFDFRNHGRNPFHGPAGHEWPQFVRDMERVWQGIVRRLGPAPMFGVFHSLSAIVGVMHALENDDRWEALALYDPSFFPRAGHPLEPVVRAEVERLTRRTRRRPERYSEPRELERHFSSRPAFRRWSERACEAMAWATLRPDGPCGWELSCPRELEAAIYETNLDSSIWMRIHRVRSPLRLICGDPTLDEGGVARLVCREMARETGVGYEAIPDTTHFLQVEDPLACVAALDRFLA
jgi:pimeloyl-ACP methyl ester carboxylesterase